MKQPLQFKLFTTSRIMSNVPLTANFNAKRTFHGSNSLIGPHKVYWIYVKAMWSLINLTENKQQNLPGNVKFSWELETYCNVHTHERRITCTEVCLYVQLWLLLSFSFRVVFHIVVYVNMHVHNKLNDYDASASHCL